jgi:hypothetical protein
MIRAAATFFGFILPLGLVGAVPAGWAWARPGLNETGSLSWSTMSDESGTVVDYPAAVFTMEGAAPPRGVGRSLQSADGSARFMMYVERNDGNLTPESYVRRNLAVPETLLDYRRVTGRFFAVSGIEEEVIFYSRCNFSDGSEGRIHCIFISYPKSEKRMWDDIVTRMSLSLHVRR